MRDWPYGFDISEEDKKDIAAAVQMVFEEQAEHVMSVARALSHSRNLVYMGGCAMNSKYNERMIHGWDDVWSLPVPGDSASAIGAALYHEKLRIKWNRELPRHIKVGNVR